MAAGVGVTPCLRVATWTTVQALFIATKQPLFAMKPFLAAIFIIFLSTAHCLAGDFMGYPCTEDCSGHEAGYSWAEEKGITDESDCGGNSQSFIEGCQAYAEEQQTQEDQENEPNEDESTEDDHGF